MLHLKLLRSSSIRALRTAPTSASRPFSTYRPLLAATPTKNEKSKVPLKDDSIFYRGPLAGTFHSLKLFSLSSLGLCLSVSPFIYLVDGAMATSARHSLVALAIATSGLSTSLVGWIASPYVAQMRRLDGKQLETGKQAPPGSIEILTRNIFLQERFTRVYDPIFLSNTTRRKFAKWELSSHLITDTSKDDVEVPERKAGGVETAAETVDAKGNVKGKWTIHWKKQDGASSDTVLVGYARSQGSIVRYFNVHEELL